MRQRLREFYEGSASVSVDGASRRGVLANRATPRPASDEFAYWYDYVDSIAFGRPNPRSVGIDQLSATPEDYAQDPGAIGWPNPAFFQHSVRVLDPDATGKLAGTQGAYRSPSLLPTQNLLVSYAGNVVALDNFDGNFDISTSLKVEVDPSTGARTPLFTDPKDDLWPVAIAPRYNLRLFKSKLDEPNGATQVFDDDDRRGSSQITFLDVPLFSTLLFQNKRTGRALPKSNFALSLWEDLPQKRA